MPHKKYLTDKATSQKYRLDGVIRSPSLPAKPNLCLAFRNHVDHRPKKLPPKVDLRPRMTPVENQSQIGSCAANSVVGAYEYLLKKATGQNIDVSRLFIYYNARVKVQNSNNVVDAGCTMTSAIEALAELGTCLESHWPYFINQVNTRPNQSAYQEARQHTIAKAYHVDTNLHEMKSCLAQGFPFAFGLLLFTSFNQAANTGVVPMPNSSDAARSTHGCHAMLAVGYSDRWNAFIVRNSWGEQWGHRGYCYIPYQYLANPNLCFDVWTVRKLAKDSFCRAHWDNSDVVSLADVTGHVGHHHHRDSPNHRHDSPNHHRDTPNHHRDSPNHHRDSPNHRHDSPNHHRDSPNPNQSNDDNCVIEDVDEDDNYDDDDSNEKNDSDNASNRPKIFERGNNHSKDNSSGFAGGYSNIDELLKGSKFFNNQLPPSPRSQPASYGRKGYGEGYGYSNS